MKRIPKIREEEVATNNPELDKENKKELVAKVETLANGPQDAPTAETSQEPVRVDTRQTESKIKEDESENPSNEEIDVKMKELFGPNKTTADLTDAEWNKLYKSLGIDIKVNESNNKGEKIMTKKIKEGEEMNTLENKSPEGIVQDKPVGSQDPSMETNTSIATPAAGNEKTPDSVVTNEIKDKDKGDITPIAKGPQDAPTEQNTPTATPARQDVKTTEGTEEPAVLAKVDTGEAVQKPVPAQDPNLINPSTTVGGADDTKDVKAIVSTGNNIGESVKEMKERKIKEAEGTSTEVLGNPEDTKFVVYDGEPKAILQDMGEAINILYDAATGETKEVKKDEVQEMGYGFKESLKKSSKKIKEDDNGPSDEECEKLAKEMFGMSWDKLGSKEQDQIYKKLDMKESRKVFIAEKSVEIDQGSFKVLLEKGDKFYVLTEDEKEEDDAEEMRRKAGKEDKFENGNGEKVKENILGKDDLEKTKLMYKDKKYSIGDEIENKGKLTQIGQDVFYTEDKDGEHKYNIMEAEGDAKDNKEDAELAKEAGMTMDQWESSKEDKKHDEVKEETDDEKMAKLRAMKDNNKEEKKPEDKKEEVFKVTEEVQIGDVVLEPGDRFIVIHEEDEEKKDEPKEDEKSAEDKAEDKKEDEKKEEQY